MNIEKKISETIKKYKLLNKKDKVVVALSGGKDSTSVFYILHKLGYDVEGLMIDLHLGDWSDKNLENMERFCSGLGVKLHIVDLKKELGQGICFIKEVLKKKKGLTGCSVCGVVKKWILNKWARKFGADVLVTGHNLDDEAQTVLMNFLKGNIYMNINAGPRTGSRMEFDKNRELENAHPKPWRSHGSHPSRKRENNNSSSRMVGSFVQRVKPLFFIPENEVREYSKKMKFPVLYERCPCAFGTYRVETREWVDKISDEEKLKVVNGWLKVKKKLKRDERELVKCESCGELASGKVCNFCKIVRCL